MNFIILLGGKKEGGGGGGGNSANAVLKGYEVMVIWFCYFQSLFLDKLHDWVIVLNGLFVG
jgi:hypothetical protein